MQYRTEPDTAAQSGARFTGWHMLMIMVAFFGTTVAHEDDPERAVLAGLAMQKALQRYAEQLHALDNIDLALRVGINTGEVIVTSVGDDRRYTAL